ncbi:pyridoxal-5-phosphate-dependent protein subunit beta, partial [Chloroflexi bacterium TSY]|nr:pyridoxal-5-phosphate-dependent protein subunit beta [Chloroflexi bacterium TSY]
MSAIKFAKYYELGANDVVLTVATDSMEMYQSRLAEQTEAEGEFTELDAVAAYHRYLLGQSIDHIQE